MPSSPEDPEGPTALENMRRMAFDRSKWLQTQTGQITKYEYTKEELNQFYNEFQDVISRIRRLLVCPLCDGALKKCMVVPCGHFFCQKCSIRWFNNKRQSVCPTCKEDCEGKSMPLYAIDAVFVDMNLFLKEAKYFQNAISSPGEPKDLTKRLKSMNFVMLQRLKNLESQMMCDFCFNRLKQTYLVICASDAFTRRPFCEGCEKKYIKFYETEQGRTFQDPFPFPLLDEIVTEFYEFLTKVVDYSKSCKQPTRFLSPSPRISLRPIYKFLVGTILIGIVLMYYSS